MKMRFASGARKTAWMRFDTSINTVNQEGDKHTREAEPKGRKKAC
jgi:hypothetical protein